MTKSKFRSYLLWFILGGFGAHRFYLRRARSAWIVFAYTVVTIGIELLLSSYSQTVTAQQLDVFYWATTVPLWIFLLRDAFLIPGWVEAINAKDHGAAVFD